MVASSTGVTGVLGLDFLDIDLDMDRLAATFGISLDSSSASGLSSCGVSIFLEQSIHTFWASLKLYSFNLYRIPSTGSPMWRKPVKLQKIIEI